MMNESNARCLSNYKPRAKENREISTWSAVSLICEETLEVWAKEKVGKWAENE